MPTDRARGSVVVAAPPDQVLAALRDVGAQADWVPEITSVEVLEENEDGTVATAAFELVTRIGSDSYTLEYEHADDGMTWTLVQGRMQKAQDGTYTIRAQGDGTEVHLDLVVQHSLHAPGFIRRRVFDGFVSGTLGGLKGYLET